MSDRPWHTFDSEGRCIAWRHSLPPGTLVCFAPDRPVWNVAPLPPSPNALVIVVAWPDGSTPEPRPDESVPLAALVAELEGHADGNVGDGCWALHDRYAERLAVIRQEVKP